MNKVAATTTAILALLTGLVLGQFESRDLHFGRPEFTGSHHSPRALATARDFYEGLDRLLETGDRSIETTVAPGFVDHTLNGQGDRTLQQMIDGWIAVGSTFPNLQLTVLELEQRDPLIAVRLEVDPGAPSSVLGVSLEAPPPHQLLEFLRVQGAGVTERWEASGQLPVVTVRMGIDVHWDAAGLVVPAIQHVVLDPGRSMQLLHGGMTILRTESGSARLDRAGVDLDGVRRPEREPLDAGQVRILDGVGPLVVRNVASVPVELWALGSDASAAKQKPAGYATAVPAQASLTAFLPLERPSDLRDSPQRMSIVRITLPAGATVAPHIPGVIEEIAVLDGVLDVTVDRGRALICTDGKTAHPFDDTVTITAGQGVSASEIATLSYRVAGPQPATMLIMRIDSSPPGNVPS